MKSKGCHLSTKQKCEYCMAGTLFSKPFYLFPCGHGYHTECMVKLYTGKSSMGTICLCVMISHVVCDSLGDTDRNRVMDKSTSMSNAVSELILTKAEVAHIKHLNEQLNQLHIKMNRDYQTNTDKRLQQSIEYVQNELDGLIANDCPLCGDIMIQLVGISLIHTNTLKDNQEKLSWEI